MAATPFDKLDLNLLRTFLVIYQAGSTVKAGEVLNLSQSAVSRTLQRLRDHFADPLFVRSPRGLSPTPRAELLAQTLPSALEELALACEPEQVFTPSNLQGNLTIALNTLAFTGIGCDIYLAIKQQAPELSIVLLSWDTTTQGRLVSGEIDVGINFEVEEISKQLRHHPIFVAEFCFLARPGHPLTRAPALTLEKISKYPAGMCIIPEINYNRLFYIEQIARLKNVHLRVDVRCEDINTLVRIVNQSNLITGGTHMYNAIYPGQLEALDFQLPEIRPRAVVAYYHKRHHHSAKYQWLLQLVTEIARNKTG